ncbi:MAG: hypothetical protein CEE43_18100 [Promethearchaeota archaeon Loki_b32]|nr:MAG: hypothetical protein CEE43_18100 [Candidatus Lokiarchaeota archaeon Loki_b32]
MEVSIKYYQVLEESLRKELVWLIDEFKILFKSKKEIEPKKDRKLANEILDYILENTLVYDNIILYNLFTETMENIEKMYPDLF